MMATVGLIFSVIFAVLSAIAVVIILWLLYWIARNVALKILKSVLLFVLISAVVLFFVTPLLKYLVLAKSYWLLLSLVVSIVIMIASFMQCDINVKIYGSVAVVMNFLISFVLFYLLYGTYFKQINDIQKAMGVELSKSLTISGDWVFTSYYISISLSTFLFYGWDKKISEIFPKDDKPYEKLDSIQKFGHRIATEMPFLKPPRVPEKVLHWHSYCGGSVGAFIAQDFFRHKSSKEPFKSRYTMTVVAQIFSLISIHVVIAIIMILI
jgi:uncharacterized membrane protein YsdA (DUF1294 family)